MEEDKEFNTVQRASEGDPEAFRELVERYGDRIFSLLTGITGNRLDAEELTSDVFLKAFTHLDRFRGVPFLHLALPDSLQHGDFAYPPQAPPHGRDK